MIINGQLSISQLITAEILVNIVLSGLLKFSQYLYDYYDFMVAICKILDLLDISKKYQPVFEHKTAILENHISSLEIILSTSQKS